MPSIFDRPTTYLDDPIGSSSSLRQSPIPPLTEEEKQSLLDSIGSGALHGLGYLGGSLSKAFGGRAIRGLLGGRPEELASIIPFSDALGITDPKNEVSGAELLGGNKDTSFFSPEGIGGLGLDIALDPSTYFGGAIIKGLGKGAQAAGRGLTAIPKIGPTIETVGQGAKGLYQRTVPPLFESAVMGMRDPSAQIVGRRITEAIPEAVARATGEVIPLAEQAKVAGFGTQQGNAALRQMGENALPRTAEAASILDPTEQMFQKSLLAKIEHGISNEQLATQRIMSGPGAGNDLGYLPRQFTPQEPKTIGEWWKTKTPTIAEEAGRRERYTGLPTERIHDLVAEDMSHLTPLQVEDKIAKDYVGLPLRAQELQAARRSGSVTAIGQAEAAFAATQKQATELAALKIAGKTPTFENSVIKDILDKHVSDHIAIMKADKIHEGVAEFSKPLVQIPDGIPLAKALEDFGMSIPVVTQNGQVVGGAMQKTFEYLQKMGKASSLADLDKLAVEPEFYNSMVRMMKAHSIDGLQDVAKIWDSVTNLNKAFQTVLWPANHARNQLTGFWNNLRVGAFNPNVTGPMKYVDPWLDANKLVKGDVVEGLAAKLQGNHLFRKMTDSEASKEYQRLVIAWDVHKDASKLHNEFAQPAKRAEEQLSQLIPGMPQKGIMEAGKGFAGGFAPSTLQEASPFGVSGVFGSTKDTSSYVKGGRELASTLDNVNRSSVFLSKLEQGMSPAEAFASSIEAHYNFGNLSQFEKQYMRRLVPYYGWMRQNVPAVLNDFLKNPGGITGQSIRTSYEAIGQEPGFTPDYLGAGVAAKIGGLSTEGRQTYLSSTGLPFEDISQLASPSGLLGSLNPLLKGPLEMATNRQFFTGRELTGTVPHTGSTVGDQLLAASPLGRFATTGRMLADPRTGWGESVFNLLSGGRVTDVDQAAAQRNAIRQYAEQQLQNSGLAKQFSRVYVPKDQQADLSPRDLAVLRLLQSR